VSFKGPSGNVIGSQINQMKNGVHRAEYEPDVVGTYRVEVFHQGKAVSNQPFYVEVTDPASVRIAEVQEAFANKESYFIGNNVHSSTNFNKLLTSLFLESFSRYIRSRTRNFARCPASSKSKRQT